MELIVCDLNKNRSKLNLKLNNISLVISDGMGFFIKRKKGRHTYIFDYWVLKQNKINNIELDYLDHSNKFIDNLKESEKLIKYLFKNFEEPKDLFENTIFFAKEIK